MSITKSQARLVPFGKAPHQLGMGKFTVIFFGAIVFALCYAGYRILPIYYYYYDTVNQMHMVIRVASLEDDNEIRRRLMYYIKKYNIPASDNALKIDRGDGSMRISLNYQVPLKINFWDKVYHVHTFKFNAVAKGEFEERKKKR